jgi:hypothetical protein
MKNILVLSSMTGFWIIAAQMNRIKNKAMKTNLLLITALFSLILSPIHAAPGDTTNLGWTERRSVGEVLPGLGYAGMTCTEGTKTEDLQGYRIIANCVKGSDRYLFDMWVSLDWTKRHVNSVTKRN